MTQYWKVWLDNGRPPMSSDDSTPEQVPVDPLDLWLRGGQAAPKPALSALIGR